MQEPEVIAKVKTWLKEIVIGLGLCPFAFEVSSKDQILYKVQSFGAAEDFLEAFSALLDTVFEEDSPYSTALMIIDQGLEQFEDYLTVYHAMEDYLEKNGLEDTFQLASFHPQYQFSGTTPEQVENYTNRSPYPMIHILQVTAVEAAINSHPDIDQVPLDNIAMLNKMGKEGMNSLLKSIYS